MFILVLHDKVSTLSFMLDTFIKEMKGMGIEDVLVEEEVKEGEANEKMEEVTQEAEEEKEEEKEKDDRRHAETVRHRKLVALCRL